MDLRTTGSAFSIRPERSEPGDAAERAALKAQLIRSDETGTQDYFALQAKCVRRFGPAAGIFIRQLVFWTDKSMLADGWLYKTRDEMQEETGLSRRQQEKARKILTKKGVLEEDIRTAPPHHHYRALHYRVRLEQLLETLTEAEDGDSEPDLRGDGTGPKVRNADTGPEVWDASGEPEVGDGSSAPPTESTQEENDRVTPEGTAGESDLQSARSERFAPEEEKSTSSKEDAHETLPRKPKIEGLAGEVRRALAQGRHSPVALRHYRARSATAEEVAHYVSRDLTGSEDGAEHFVPIVRDILKDLDAAEATS